MKINKSYLEILPLTFQNTSVNKIKIHSKNDKKTLISIRNINSNKILPYSLNKPISKMIKIINDEAL